MNSDYQDFILQHQNALDKVSSKKTKLWWEQYMKGVIPFRGVGIPKNRELLGEWRTRNGIDKWSYEDQFDLALLFFKEPIAEDKLAGILYIQNFLLDNIPWELQIDKYDAIYQERLIFDWNVCDWFCVRVLGEIIKKNGKDCAVAISRWSNVKYLWQAEILSCFFCKLGI